MAQLDNVKLSAQGTVTDPKDFSEGGGDHRKSVLASTALIVVLLASKDLKPTVFGVSVSVSMLWICLGLAHMYFFTMWRLTTNIEADKEKRFWNLWGLWKQAVMGVRVVSPERRRPNCSSFEHCPFGRSSLVA